MDGESETICREGAKAAAPSANTATTEVLTASPLDAMVGRQTDVCAEGTKQPCTSAGKGTVEVSTSNVVPAAEGTRKSACAVACAVSCAVACAEGSKQYGPAKLVDVTKKKTTKEMAASASPTQKESFMDRYHKRFTRQNPYSTFAQRTKATHPSRRSDDIIVKKAEDEDSGAESG
eukprot:scpid95308/ scgid17492/ 